MTSKKLLKDVPNDEKQIHALANEMIAWARNENSFSIDDFPISKSFSPFQFFKLGENNAYFVQAVDITNAIISTRIQEGWRTGKIHPMYAASILPLYNGKYRTWILEKSGQIEAEAPQRMMTVIIPDALDPEKEQRITFPCKRR